MQLHKLTPTELLKAIGIGIGIALLLPAVMVPALRLGISPLPKPLGLALAETVLGRSLPLPVGLLFHVAYVTAWSVVYVVLFRHALTFGNALLLGIFLWLLVLLLFFPIVGWGVLGLAVSPKLIVASLVPHLLFAVCAGLAFVRLAAQRSSAPDGPGYLALFQPAASKERRHDQRRISTGRLRARLGISRTASIGSGNCRPSRSGAIVGTVWC